MSTHEQITNNPTSAVRNTGGRNGPQGLEEPMSDEILREMCDKNYHQLLPLIAEKMQKEKEQKDKLNAVKARLIYGEESGIKIRSREESHYSESKTPTARTEPRRRHGNRYSRSPSPHAQASVFKRLKKNRSPSPRLRPRKEGGVFNRLGRKEPATSARSDSRQRSPQAKRTEAEERSKKAMSTNGTHHLVRLINIQLIEKIRLNGGKQSISRIGEIISSSKRRRIYEVFMERYKAEALDVEGAPDKCMRISGFMHGITHPGLIKRLYKRIPRSMDEIYRYDLSTSYKGKVYCTQSRLEKSAFTMEPSKGGEGTTEFQEEERLQNKQRPDRKPDRFSLLIKKCQKKFSLGKKESSKLHPNGKLLWKKEIRNKYWNFHSDTGHSTAQRQRKKNRKKGKRPKRINLLTITDESNHGKSGTSPGFTQSSLRRKAMSFPPLREEDGTEGPMIIEVEMGGHFVHRGSDEFARLHLIGFSGETIWPLGQIALLVKIGDEVHSTSAWMNFMVISKGAISAGLDAGHMKAGKYQYIFASKRLKRYFQAYTVVVITNQPIKQLLSSSEISGRMLIVEIRVKGYDIQYRTKGPQSKAFIGRSLLWNRPEEESPGQILLAENGKYYRTQHGTFVHRRLVLRRRLRGRTNTNKPGRGRIYIRHEV
ncbi:hypothetical protein Tco_0385430 [Tanacetum coccineum]